MVTSDQIHQLCKHRLTNITPQNHQFFLLTAIVFGIYFVSGIIAAMVDGGGE
jgi:hypothetical protein